MATLIQLSKKLCACCKEVKDRNLFGTQNQRKDGLNPYCKKCKNKKAADAAELRQRTNQAPKACLDCGIIKEPSEYNSDRRRPDGLQVYCRPCSNTRDAQAYAKRKVNPAWVYRDARQSKKRRDERRAKIISHYSNGANQCACCGEHRMEFLSVDHINGGGRQHRKQVSNFYSWLVRNDFPDGFRILCHNCNLARGIYGCCPHEKEQQTINGTAGAIDLASGTLRVSAWQH